MKQRNYSIDFLKIIFTIVIAIHHFQEAIGITFISHGDLAVEFFFMVSGYYLMDSFSQNYRWGGQKQSACDYILRRYKKLYPHYLFSLVVLVGALILASREADYILDKLIQTIPELFMLQDIGVFYYSGSNYPAWYLSVLMVLSYFLYLGLSLNKTVCVKVIYPLLLLLGSTLLFSGEDNSIVHWSAYGVLYMPLIRGLVDMIIGILIWKCVHADFKIDFVFSLMLNIMAWFLIIVAMFGEKTQDSLVLLGFAILLVLYFSQSNLFSKFTDIKLFGTIGKYTYAICLNHSLVIRIVKLFGEKLQTIWLVIVFLVVLFAYSVVTENIVRYLTNHVKERKNNG